MLRVARTYGLRHVSFQRSSLGKPKKQPIDYGMQRQSTMQYHWASFTERLGILTIHSDYI